MEDPLATPIPDYAHRVAMYDMDRTITRSGTYSGFLMHVAQRRQQWRLLLLPLVGLNAAAVALGTQGLAVSIVLLPLAAITTILYGALRSAGDVTVPMAYSIATSVVVLAPPPSSSP